MTREQMDEDAAIAEVVERLTDRYPQTAPTEIIAAVDEAYGYFARAHHRLIGAELTRLGKDYDRLLVVLPPQVGKSSLVSELLPFWWLAHHPSHRIGIASYAASLALKPTSPARVAATLSTASRATRAASGTGGNSSSSRCAPPPIAAGDRSRGSATSSSSACIIRSVASSS